MIAEDHEHVAHLVERDVVELHRLARGEVALAQRRVLLRNDREALELLGGDAAEGQLHPRHLAVRLALSVDALPQPELRELELVAVPREELAGLGAEVLEFFLEDADRGSRSVRAYRRRHQRAPLAASWRDWDATSRDAPTGALISIKSTNSLDIIDIRPRS